MKKFLSRVRRFFWSWGFLKFVLWSITIIVLLYAEEDWRGARAWAATKAEWEAKGETFDFNRLIPSPVPDDQNLAALPLFKMEIAPDDEYNDKGNLAPLTLRRATKLVQPTSDFIDGRGDWENGGLPNVKKIRNAVLRDHAEAFKTPRSENEPLAQFDSLYPFLADLRTASAARPYCRFQQNYRNEPPYNLYLSLLTEQIATSKFLTQHAILALDVHQPDLALEDVKTNFKIASGLKEQPLLVSGLCGIGVTAIGLTAVYDGLALHEWNDVQLADLESELAHTDFLADYQRAMRGETIGLMIPAFDNLKIDRPHLLDPLKTYGQTPEPKSKRPDFIFNVWANGWIDLTKAQGVTVGLSAASFVDPKARLVFPEATNQLAEKIMQRRSRWDAYAPWNIFSNASADPLIHSVVQFARIQVWVDEACIACALERYHLAQGVHPISLNALVPGYITSLPHDIMNGESYHYRLNSDGTFILYSVGWNQKDDGGKVVYEKDRPVRDSRQGDWVWPLPQYSNK